MARHVRSLGFLGFGLLFLVTVLEGSGVNANSNSLKRREHSLIKPYKGSALGVPYWDFIGSTVVTNDYTRLTPEAQSKFGAIWNNVPCNVRSWELHVHFRVHGSGQKFFGDGLAIWYAKERMKPGPVFGSVDKFTGLAVFLDTYSNHIGLPQQQQTHQNIYAMVSNGDLRYDHETDGSETRLASCQSQFRNKNYETFVAVRYQAGTIMVSTDVDNKTTWKKCFSVTGINLQTGYYFAVSAVTGELADNHDVISIKMYDLDAEEVESLNTATHPTELPETQLMDAAEVPADDVSDSHFMGSMVGLNLLAVTSLFLIGLGGCFVAGIIVHKQQEHYRKRFY